MERGRAKKKCNNLGMEKGAAPKKRKNTSSNPSTLIVHVNAYGRRKKNRNPLDVMEQSEIVQSSPSVYGSRPTLYGNSKWLYGGCPGQYGSSCGVIRKQSGVLEAVRDCSVETIRACTASLQIARQSSEVCFPFRYLRTLVCERLPLRSQLVVL